MFQYYNAEVTGVSERTCVVHFTDYGNHEEVLQGDCIPIPEVGFKYEKKKSLIYFISWTG